MQPYEDRQRFKYLILWGVLCMLAVGFLGLVYMYLRMTRGDSQTAIARATESQAQILSSEQDATGEAIAAAVTETMVSTVTLPPEQTATPAGELYVVQEGDTLLGIALFYDLTVDILIEVNGLADDMIFPGQELLIPVVMGAMEETTAAETAEPATPTPEVDQFHSVLAYETVDSIATWYGVTPEDIRSANGMMGDAILIGQQLVIPAGSGLVGQAFRFSPLDGNAFMEVYPTERFTLHYAAGSYPSYDPVVLAGIEQKALDHLERTFDTGLDVPYDVYIAGSLFAPPDQHLRGRSYSEDLHYFILHDGSGNADDQQYAIAHELTHLYMWNVFGVPSSTMLSEGAAVYSGMQFIAGSNHLPLEQFCAAMLQEGVLPRVSTSLRYTGHNNDLVNYYAAGCFVGYLMETHGAENLGAVYSRSNYVFVYGQSIEGLEAAWIDNLTSAAALLGSQGVDSAELAAQVQALMVGYQQFMPVFNGSDTHLEAYRNLDMARIALLENRLGEASAALEAHQNVLAGN